MNEVSVAGSSVMTTRELTRGHTRLTTRRMTHWTIHPSRLLTQVRIELGPTSMCVILLRERSLTAFLLHLSAHSASGYCATGSRTASSRHAPLCLLMFSFAAILALAHSTFGRISFQEYPSISKIHRFRAEK